MTIFHVIDNSYPDSYIETAKLIPNALNTCYFLLLGYFQDKYKGLFTGTVKITSFVSGTFDPLYCTDVMCEQHHRNVFNPILRPIHIEWKFSLMFVIYSLICFAFAWFERQGNTVTLTVRVNRTQRPQNFKA